MKGESKITTGKTRWTLFICVFMIFSGIIIGATDLTLYTEENLPLSGTVDKNPGGFTVEIAQEIQRRLGEKTPIQIFPWARGYAVIFPTLRIKERENLFKWVGPISTVKASFYALKNSGIKIANLNDAKAVASIGIPRKFWSEQFLLDEGFTNLDFANNPQLMIKKLLAGRNPVIVSIDFTIPTQLANEGASENDVISLFTFLEKSHFFAFSLSTPDDIVAKWQKTLDEMKKDGSFAKVFNKWLPGKKMPK
jgi:polar amino acid transport system substrate-binding protein